jgi:hypothetical protein
VVWFSEHQWVPNLTHPSSLNSSSVTYTVFANLLKQEGGKKLLAIHIRFWEEHSPWRVTSPVLHLLSLLLDSAINSSAHLTS